MAFDLETLMMLTISNVLNGAAIGAGVFLAMMIFLRMMRKELPGMVHQIQQEMIKANTMSKVADIRNKYK